MSNYKRCPFCGCDIEIKKFEYANGESDWEPDGDHDKACPLSRVLWCFFPERIWTEEKVTASWNMRYEASDCV